MLLKDQEVIGGLYFLVTYRSLLFIAHAPIFHMQVFFVFSIFASLFFQSALHAAIAVVTVCNGCYWIYSIYSSIAINILIQLK